MGNDADDGAGFDEKDLESAAKDLTEGKVQEAVAGVVGVLVKIITGHAALGGLAEGGTERVLHALSVAPATERLLAAVKEDAEEAEKRRLAQRARDDLAAAVDKLLGPRLEELRKAGDDNFLQTAKLLARALDTLGSAPTPALSLPVRTWDPDRAPPASLLRADSSEPVPFRGREKEVEDLTAWCDRAPQLALRLYTGPGGMGKTRLMTEICRRLGSALPGREAWRTGFLQSPRGPVAAEAWTAAFAHPGPWLVVVDYAETRRTEVLNLVRRFLEARVKARIVLLARAKGDWWGELLQADPEIRDFFASRSVEALRLGALAGAIGDRNALFQEAVSHFRARLGARAAAVQSPDLSGAIFDRVLILHMVALALAEGQAGLETEDHILEYVLGREEAFWRKLTEARGLPPSLVPALEVAMAAITLTGGIGRDLARQYVGSAPIFQGQPASSLEAVAQLLHDAYPGTDSTSIEPLQPDILGEHLAFRVLARGGPDADFIRERL